MVVWLCWVSESSPAPWECGMMSSAQLRAMCLRPGLGWHGEGIDKSHFGVPSRLVGVMLHPEHLSWFSLGAEQRCCRCHSMRYRFTTLKWVQVKHGDSLRETIHASGLDMFSKRSSTTSLVSCSHSWVHLSKRQEKKQREQKIDPRRWCLIPWEFSICLGILGCQVDSISAVKLWSRSIDASNTEDRG